MSTRRSLVLLAATMILAPAMSFAQWAADPGTTVRNEFGPRIGDGASTCRGACGGGCHPANCEPDVYLECVSGSHFRIVRTYDCGTNDGCREHDDCLDECARRYPGAGRMPGELADDLLEGGVVDDALGVVGIGEGSLWRPVDRNFYVGECSFQCHAEARETFGTENTASWARGRGPFDGRNVFEYTVDVPGQEEQWYRCPDGTKLTCDGGRGQCEKDEEPEEPEEPEETEVPAIGVTIVAPGICNDPNQPLDLLAEVIGLASPNVSWSVLSGPATVNPNSGRLVPQSEGTVMVEAVSVSDPLYRDQVAVYFGRCECSFEATLSGDTNRGTVGGLYSVFSTRGQASIMGASGGGPEYWQDLANVAEMAEGLRDAVGLGEGAGEGAGNMDFLRRMADQAAEASPGSTIGIVLIEGNSANPAPGGLAGAFKIDVLAEGGIGPGFSGILPVKLMALHTGEFAEEGGAPSYFMYDPESKDWPGEVTLMVHEYDGQWMRGSVTGNALGALIVGQERRTRLRFSAEFTAGISNPLRMENACLMAWAAEADKDSE